MTEGNIITFPMESFLSCAECDNENWVILITNNEISGFECPECANRIVFKPLEPGANNENPTE